MIVLTQEEIDKLFEGEEPDKKDNSRRAALKERMKEASERYYRAMRLYRTYRVAGPDGIDMTLALDEKGVRELMERGWWVSRC